MLTMSVHPDQLKEGRAASIKRIISSPNSDYFGADYRSLGPVTIHHDSNALDHHTISTRDWTTPRVREKADSEEASGGG